MSHHMHRRAEDPPALPVEPPPPITVEQLDFFTAQTERAATKAARRALRSALIGYLILLAGLLAGTSTYTNYQTDALRDGLTGSCQRVNVLRAQSNLSDMVSWNILSVSGRRELDLAKTDLAPTRPAHRMSARVLLDQARTLTVTSMTDCKAAVEDPLGYKQHVASPIGDPATGKVNPEIQDIVNDSHDVVNDVKFG